MWEGSRRMDCIDTYLGEKRALTSKLYNDYLWQRKSAGLDTFRA